MYKHNAKQLFLPHEFFMPDEGQLNPENRWCKLARMIPWETAEERQKETLGNTNAGQKAYSVRMALLKLIFSNKKYHSDRETVAEITENPYLQYFIGLPDLVQAPTFDASRLVYYIFAKGCCFWKKNRIPKVTMTLLGREPPRVVKTLALRSQRTKGI